jgi:DNA-binding transcriptional LysR family regulator
MSNLAALEAGEIDIAVVFEPGGHAKNEVLMVDPTVWVTSDQHQIHERHPVPIATYTYLKGGWCDALALKSLKRRGIESRVAYISRTSNGLIAAVTSGLAIAPLTRSSIPAGCRELTAADGYDVIDFSNVVLKTKARNANNRIVESMANAIREAFRAPAAHS